MLLEISMWMILLYSKESVVVFIYIYIQDTQEFYFCVKSKTVDA